MRYVTVGDVFFFFSSRRRHTRYWRDWSSDVCSSDLIASMWHILMRIIIGVLLIVHGFAHWEITSAWGSKESATSWLMGEAGALGTMLWAGTLIGDRKSTRLNSSHANISYAVFCL